MNIGNLVMLFVPLLTSLLSFLVFAQADIRGDRARELEREREELEEEFELGEQYQIYQKEGLMKFDDDAYDLQQLQNAEQLYRNRAQQTLLNLRFELAREFGAEETERSSRQQAWRTSRCLQRHRPLQMLPCRRKRRSSRSSPPPRL